jgi:hypothetical protein
MAKINLIKINIKDQVKDKPWKNMSSSEKDEILFEVAKKLDLIPPDSLYE